MKIFAVDPGKRTGWALWAPGSTVESGECEHFDFLRFAQDEVDSNTVVVCENFLITYATLKKSRQTWSLEQIGALRYWCWREDAEFVLQTPAEAKGFATDDRLKHLGWWQKGQRHANDALRHLLLYAVRESLITGDELR